MKSHLKISNQWDGLRRQVNDYLRYTFTPMFGLLLSIGSLGTLATIAILRDNPPLVLKLFYLFVIIFFCAMVVSFLAWRRYRKFYNSVFK